ncbi:hypothetical protein [Haloarchaeobius sp. DYHT-AS-18]|uniref:hypothetical protein n=1 Tax=Haloarchaeobius sp. DYHT-AS-18 TaxID=3446117 RepID=UPI003EBA44CC
MSQNKKSDQSVYAAGLARQFLRGDLDGLDPEFINQYAGLIDDEETLEQLNYWKSIYEDVGEDFESTRLYEIVVGDAATKSMDRAFSDGQVSKLQGAVGLVRQQNDATDALAEIVRRLSQEGTIAVVTGPPGAGKTSTTVDIARAWGAWTGGKMYGVTTWDGFDQVVSSDLEMLEAMASHKNPSLGVLDETMQELTGRGADVEKAEVFATRASLIRKREDEHGPHPKKGSLLLVSHVWGRMNKPTREMTTLVIQKPSRADPGKVVLWESEGGEDSREKIAEFTGLTDSRETFPEHEASSFRIVLDEDEEDEDGPSVAEVEKRKDIETAIRAAKPWTDDGGMNYREIADTSQNGEESNGIVPYGKSWVGEKVREWKSGQYRDLVDDPRGENA